MAASHVEIYLKSAELDYTMRQEVLLHMDSICRIARDDMVTFCLTFGDFYADHGRLDDAEKLYLRALAGYEKALGPDHTSTLHTVNNLGNLYYRQGRLSEAEKLYQRALAGQEKALEPDHTYILITVHNLAVLYAAQGRLSEAEKMYLRALAGKEKALGPEHTSTLITVDSLDRLYTLQGRSAEAEKMFHCAQAGKKKASDSWQSSSPWQDDVQGQLCLLVCLKVLSQTLFP